MKGLHQMEVDSAHSFIVRKIQKGPIYSPAEYVEKIREARPQKQDKVIYLTHQFIRDHSALKYSSDQANAQVVYRISILQYSQGGALRFKMRFKDDFAELNKPRPQITNITASLHEEQLFIKESKYVDLQHHKEYIPQDCQAF